MRRRLCWQISKCWTIEHLINRTEAVKIAASLLTRTEIAIRFGILFVRQPQRQPLIRTLQQEYRLLIKWDKIRWQGKRTVKKHWFERLRYFWYHLTEVTRKNLTSEMVGPLPNDTRVNLAQAASMLISFYCIVKRKSASWLFLSLGGRPGAASRDMSLDMKTTNTL